ncbi:hypothetical protein B0T24DRAFT_631644 [Lasiosphaeria ovina]|uniref:Uncharacterized protein n=1 Tax=Lasiosphaeria ovina TaxID=92902 RepID=A0AAE0K3Y7_9PEZI|nr:hypothetical protein B0T24DRAFT_631644 [Lasiosphaeria ovina]
MRRKSETHRLTTLFPAMLCLISCYGEVSIDGHSDLGRITCPTLTLGCWARFAALPLLFAVGCSQAPIAARIQGIREAHKISAKHWASRVSNFAMD